MKAGRKTCVAVNYGDKSPVEYFGYYASCALRNPLLTASQVKPFDYVTKTFDVNHVYTKRGLYPMLVYGYDERYYAEASLDLVLDRFCTICPTLSIQKSLMRNFLQI